MTKTKAADQSILPVKGCMNFHKDADSHGDMTKISKG